MWLGGKRLESLRFVEQLHPVSQPRGMHQRRGSLQHVRASGSPTHPERRIIGAVKKLLQELSQCDSDINHFRYLLRATSGGAPHSCCMLQKTSSCAKLRRRACVFPGHWRGEARAMSVNLWPAAPTPALDVSIARLYFRRPTTLYQNRVKGI